MLLQEIHDSRLGAGRIRRRISVYLPRVSGGLPPIRRHPFFDCLVRLVHAIVGAAVHGNRSLAPWRCGRVHVAGNVYKNLDAGNYFAKRPSVIAAAGQ